MAGIAERDGDVLGRAAPVTPPLQYVRHIGEPIQISKEMYDMLRPMPPLRLADLGRAQAEKNRETARRLEVWRMQSPFYRS